MNQNLKLMLYTLLVPVGLALTIGLSSAYTKWTGNTYTGPASERAWVTSAAHGTRYVETDTAKLYVWDSGTGWRYNTITIPAGWGSVETIAVGDARYATVGSIPNTSAFTTMGQIEANPYGWITSGGQTPHAAWVTAGIVSGYQPSGNYTTVGSQLWLTAGQMATNPYSWITSGGQTPHAAWVTVGTAMDKLNDSHCTNCHGIRSVLADGTGASISTSATETKLAWMTVSASQSSIFATNNSAISFRQNGWITAGTNGILTFKPRWGTLGSSATAAPILTTISRASAINSAAYTLNCDAAYASSGSSATVKGLCTLIWGTTIVQSIINATVDTTLSPGIGISAKWDTNANRLDTYMTHITKGKQ